MPERPLELYTDICIAAVQGTNFQYTKCEVIFVKLIKAQRNSKEAVWSLTVYIDIYVSQEGHNSILITLYLSAVVVEAFRKFIQDFTTWYEKPKEDRKPDTVLTQGNMKSDPQDIALLRNEYLT